MKKLIVYLVLSVTILCHIVSCQPTHTPTGTQTDTQAETQVETHIETQANTQAEVQTEAATSAEEEVYQPYVQMTPEQLNVLYQEELYAPNMEGIVLKDRPLIKTFVRVLWWIFDGSIQEHLQKLENISDVHYVTMDDVMQEVYVDQSGKVTFRKTYDASTLFLQDFKAVNTTIELLDQPCYVYEVICVDTTQDNDGFINYIITDKGIYIKYYPLIYPLQPLPEVMTFSEADFMMYLNAYRAYLSGPEWDPQADGSCTLAGFMTNQELLQRYLEVSTQ